MRVGTIPTLASVLIALCCPIVGQGETALTHGPFLGHTTPRSVSVWGRATDAGEFELVARSVRDRERHSVVARAVAENDRCVVWTLDDLVPNTQYTYEVRSGGEAIADQPAQRFTTAPEADSPTVSKLAFGSCAREDAGSIGVWRQMQVDDPDAVVLLGDTPYIDSTDLQHQRVRYQAFAGVPEFAGLLQGRPLYATWDDHDFGKNDTNGILPGKETSRRVFVEYHANPSYGDGQHGVYTKFRRGSVEVFLLDARYFAAVEPSPFDDQKPSLLGAKQWDWLQGELKASTAPFKVLAAGMIWNGAVRPNKPDHWETYAHEREALFEFLGREKISGVVLVGGDIHRTRVLKHSTTMTVGYPVTELITSPIHDGIIESANAPHPDLVFDAGMPHSYLLIEVDSRQSPATLTARFRNSAGRDFYSSRLVATELRAAE